MEHETGPLRKALAAMAVALAVAACGGGGGGGPPGAGQAPGAAQASPAQPAAPQQVAAPLPPAATAQAADTPLMMASPLRSSDIAPPDAASFLDWAERTYPLLFPGHKPDYATGPYVYRHYPESGNYLAVGAGSAYVLGTATGGKLVAAGSLGDFTCEVFFEQCSLAEGDIRATAVTTRFAQVLGFGRDVRLQFLTFSLSGRPAVPIPSGLYLKVVDPLQLHTVHELHIDGDAPPGRLQLVAYLRWNARGATGRQVGEMVVHVCLDAACRRRIDGPLHIPYAYDIGGVPTAASTEVRLAPYVRPAPVTIPVSVPAIRWGAMIPMPPRPSWMELVRIDSTTSEDMMKGTVEVTLPEMPPGRYELPITLTASTAQRPVPEEARSHFTLHIVVEGPEPPAFTCPPQEATIRGPGAQEVALPLCTTRPWTITTPGELIDLRPAGTPAFARVSPYGNGSLSLSNCPGVTCLPPGTYTATWRQGLLDEFHDVATTVDVPIRMTISP
jgi:hypothetical protein